MSNYNPIRRQPIRPKPRDHKESMPWRAKKVRLSGKEMGQLRQRAFFRSQGRCENSTDGARCPKLITWMTFHLSHIVSRGRGGSDVIENVLAACFECHDADTKNRRKLEPHRDWIAAA
jgi:5-methylcytosine-specific restriction endonuclease McrA